LIAETSTITLCKALELTAVENRIPPKREREKKKTKNKSSESEEE